MKKLLTLLVYGLAAALIAACSPATQQSPDGEGLQRQRCGDTG